MKKDIYKAVEQIIQDVEKRPLYPERKHLTIASNYPEGKLKYFRDQRFELLKVIPENSMFGNAWVNSDTPKITTQILVDFYNNVFVNPPKGITYQSQSEFNDFLKNDLISFLRDYIAYSKMGNELIPEQSNDELPGKDHKASNPLDPELFKDQNISLKAKDIFNKAIDAGFIDKDYKFNGNQNQMAIFVALASKKLELTKKQWRNSRTIDTIQWKPFEEFWNVKGLANNYNKIRNLSTKVTDIDKIENIFI